MHQSNLVESCDVDKGERMGSRRFADSNLKIAIAALIPVAALAMIVLHYSVNVPFADEWVETAAMRGFSHVPTISNLFSQHSEHRLAVTRLILWVSTAVSGGDLRYSMAVTFAVAIFTSIMAMVLIRRTVPSDQPWQVYWLAIHFLILSPVQYSNWLWAIQNQCIVSIACLMAGLVVIEVLPGGWRQTLLCMFLAFIAAFSMTNGLMVSVLLPLAVLAHRPRESRARLAAWALFIAALWITYFHGWQRPTFGDADPTWCLHHPKEAAEYILTFLGSCVGRGLGTVAPTVAGAVVLAVWLSELGYVAIHRGKRDSLRHAGPWIAVGIFAIASASMATTGRVRLGISQALASRYTTTSVQLWVSAIALWPILFATTPARRPLGIAKTLGMLAVSGLIISFFISQIRCINEIHTEWAERLRSQAGLELMYYPNSDSFVGGPIDPDLLSALIEMNDMGRLNPPILPADQFDSITSQTPAEGSFQEAITQPNGSIQVAGTAALPSGRPADCVLITCGPDAAHSTIIWMARVAIPKLDIANITASEASRAHWKDKIPAKQIPPGNATLAAWAFDATSRTAYPLDKSRSGSQ